MPPANRVVHGECLELLRTLGDASIDLVYIDPPFNTGKVQKRVRMKTVRDEVAGDRTGFAGRRYRTERLGEDTGFADAFDDYLAFLDPRLREARRVLKETGHATDPPRLRMASTETAGTTAHNVHAHVGVSGTSRATGATAVHATRKTMSHDAPACHALTRSGGQIDSNQYIAR